MFNQVLQKVFGSSNDREVKRLKRLVDQISTFEPQLKDLSDEGLKDKTRAFKSQLAEGADLDSLLPEAFAVVREASVRVLGMRHFDVQMMGGITLHNGRIAEMRTGEGKTLVATLPVYLNALMGKGVYVVTVNDYLATRDGNWMRPLYEFLGLSLGIVVPNMETEEKRAAYESDITYGTNNEFGFDYLRDNMAFTLDERVQREKYFAIVDEVDSILIDEARTPLIISGPSEDSSKLYLATNRIIPSLKEAEVTIGKDNEQEIGPGHYTLDEKNRHVELTEEGHDFIEAFLLKDKLLVEGQSLYSAQNLKLLHHVQTALKAHVLFKKNVDYIVQNNEIVLIDEHTGRSMPGRRLSEGLHQAIEAKEGVDIQSESQTLASTTFQNYFRLFDKLAGMTGTADTEAQEFHQIYSLSVVVMPTNKPIARLDQNDLIYMSIREKFQAIVKDILAYQQKGAPILVGTASIESSELLSTLLKKEGIEHKVLNAKYHAQEADIIAQAGQPKAVTIATNMAGRGTDIVLGGNLEAELATLDSPSEDEVQKRTQAWEKRHQAVLDSGGLHILGTERHESRRVDNQLRGRAGRQGDPGVTRFYLSLEDDLMRIFASDRVRNIMQALGMEEGEAIEHRMVTGAIEKAQKKVEGRNFDIRKSLLEFDDVANEQRQVVYKQRDDILTIDNLGDLVNSIRQDVASQVFRNYIPEESLEDMWDVAGLEKVYESDFAMQLPIQKWLDEDEKLSEDHLLERITKEFDQSYQLKVDTIGEEIHRFEKHVMLQVLDGLWKEHLAMMDHLRMGIHLRGYAGKNPKQEYKRESFELFQEMLENMKYDLTSFLMQVRIQSDAEIQEAEASMRLEHEKAQEKAQSVHAELSAMSGAESSEAGEMPAEPAKPFIRQERKVGRNEPCPCGSGKKYKQCHGALN